MSYAERRSIFGLLFTIGYVIAFYRIMAQEGIRDFTLQNWGTWYLIYFGGLVIGRIVFTVAHAVVEAVVIGIKTKDESRINAEIIDDERTKLIDLKSTYHIGTFMFLGFMGGVILLALNQSIHDFFLAMYAGIALAGLSYDGLALYYFRISS